MGVEIHFDELPVIRLIYTESFRIGLLFLLLLVIYWILGLRFTNKIPLSGDEPHYFMIAHSLWQDGDLDLKPNYHQREFFLFSPREIFPHRAFSSQDRLYSYHGIGLPVLILLPYGLAGRWGVTLLTGFMMAITGVFIYLVGRMQGYSTGNSMLSVYLIGLTLPMLPYAFHVYPDTPGALIMIILLYCVLNADKSNAKYLIYMSLPLAALCWFHSRFILLQLIFLAFISWHFRTRKFEVIGLWGVVISSILGLCYFNLVLFGVFSPAAGYGSQSVTMFEPAKIGLRLLGLFFDQEFGLLPVAPLYAICLIGLCYMRKDWIYCLIVTVASAELLLVASYVRWHGGWAAPCRYWIVVLPLLGVGLMEMLSRSRFLYQVILITIPALISLFNTATILLNPKALYSQGEGFSKIYHHYSHLIDVTPWLPSYVKITPYSLLFTGFWILVIAARGFAFSRYPLKAKAIFGLCVVLLGIALFSLTDPPNIRQAYEAQIQEAIETRLSGDKVKLLTPPDGIILGKQAPIFSWEPVEGAFEYIVLAVFPDGTRNTISVKAPSCSYKIDDAIWQQMPNGRYLWSVTPASLRRTGKMSDIYRFEIQR